MAQTVLNLRPVIDQGATGRNLAVPSPEASLESTGQSEGLPLHLNFVWSAAGNITYAISQWGMIVALAKLTNAFMVGQFALGIAIATPVLSFANLQLRSAQASDARGEYRFSEYLGLRFITTLVAFVAVVLFAFGTNHTPGTAKVVCAVALAKSVE